MNILEHVFLLNHGNISPESMSMLLVSHIGDMDPSQFVEVTHCFEKYFAEFRICKNVV